MKLKKYTTQRKGDNLEVHALWSNKFRKQAWVTKIQGASEEPLGDRDGLLLEGDVKEVHGLLFGMATIAWDMGWRPPGLLETTMKHIQDYKISAPR